MALAKLIIKIIALIVSIVERVPCFRPKRIRYNPKAVQSKVLEGPELIRRSVTCPESGLVSVHRPDIKTLFENFRAGVAKSGELPCLGVRRGTSYEWQTYNEVWARVTNFGAGLIHRGTLAGQETFVGIYAPNRPEWVIAEQACNAYSQVVVPLYDTLGPDAAQFILKQANIRTVVCDGSKLANLLRAVSGTRSADEKEPLVRLVVSMDDVKTEQQAEFEKAGITLLSFRTIEADGKANPKEYKPPAPGDLATVCYTSGTTGDPKGAMLTHANLIANVAAIYVILKEAPHLRLTNADAMISYLPLAHMFERVMQVRQYGEGARVGFFGGDILKLTEDMQILKPSVFPVVPRLLNKFYDKINAGAASTGGVKKMIFDQAVASKTADLKRGIIRRTSIWDRLVFKKVQAIFGGNVRFMITGAAPISEKVLTFMRVAMGVVMVEGYGQTEATAGTNITLVGDSVPCHVGPPMVCTEIKLVDVADMKYFAAENKGEICFRGTNVFKGYLNNKEQTAAALDKDGWLHSGDIGEWQPNGSLKIIDRKKAIFKLSQGEYIAPEKIENVSRQAQTAQIFVYGSSLQAQLVAIVVVEPNELALWAKKNGKEGDVSALIRDPSVNAFYLKDLNEIGARAKLQSFEQIRAVHLTTTPFTVENGCLTPTFKAKRNVIAEKFKAEIEALYAGLEASASKA